MSKRTPKTYNSGGPLLVTRQLLIRWYLAYSGLSYILRTPVGRRRLGSAASCYVYVYLTIRKAPLERLFRAQAEGW
jgi:hypothetical protein